MDAIGRIDEAVINSKLYEDTDNFITNVDVTLPDLSAITQDISGLGIAGNVTAAIVGHFDAMTMSITYRTITKQCIKLSEPRIHNLTILSAIQDEDTATGTITIRTVKHVLQVLPINSTGGTLQPASPMSNTGEFAVRYWATYIDGEKVREIDQWNMICYMNGVDYLAEARKSLG